MAIAACGYQWIAIGTYRGPWMLMDGIAAYGGL